METIKFCAWCYREIKAKVEDHRCQEMPSDVIILLDKMKGYPNEDNSTNKNS